jgi:MinD-like ATPase involved in chromosome partitioning or flagellar assembly
MALANVAALLAQWGKRVLVVDWDLEAPGIERFFQQEPSRLIGSRKETPGIVDLILGVRDDIRLNWRECLLTARPFPASELEVITAGRTDQNYVTRLRELDWESLFAEHDLGIYLEDLRKEWVRSYDFVLIDSRTGISDIGSICTVLLPDIVVLTFTTSDQSIEGIIDVMRRARDAQGQLPIDRGRLSALPLLSRDERENEHDLSRLWRVKIADQIGEFCKDWLPVESKPMDVLDLLYIPYIPYWSFGERLPVVESEPGSRDFRSITSAYRQLALLISHQLDWAKVQGVDINALEAARRFEEKLRVAREKLEREEQQLHERLREAEERLKLERKLVQQKQHEAEMNLELERERVQHLGRRLEDVDQIRKLKMYAVIANALVFTFSLATLTIIWLFPRFLSSESVSNIWTTKVAPLVAGILGSSMWNFWAWIREDDSFSLRDTEVADSHRKSYMSLINYYSKVGLNVYSLMIAGYVAINSYPLTSLVLIATSGLGISAVTNSVSVNQLRFVSEKLR